MEKRRVSLLKTRNKTQREAEQEEKVRFVIQCANSSRPFTCWASAIPSLLSAVARQNERRLNMANNVRKKQE